MTNNVTRQMTCVVEAILDAVEEIGFKLRLLSDEELAQLIRTQIGRGTDTVSALVKFAEHHGGHVMAIRVARHLRKHGPKGSGRHLWNRADGNRFVLVEGSDA